MLDAEDGVNSAPRRSDCQESLSVVMNPAARLCELAAKSPRRPTALAYNLQPMNLEQKLQELKKRDHLAQEGGGAERRKRQHKEGKMSARERVEFLLDEGTFEETDKLVTHRCNDFGMAEQKYYGDGFITGYGRDRKSTRLNSSHGYISYAVFCLKKKNNKNFPLMYNRLQPYRAIVLSRMQAS